MKEVDNTIHQNESDEAFKVRDPLIKGVTDTVRESHEFSSRNHVDSVNISAGRQKKDKNVKRESIYK